MMQDIDKETIDYQPNYDDRLQEPVVLPAKYPNLLVNGCTGIAVGMATNIPPHNLNEVVGALELLIDNPDATLDELMEHIKGPDFPTGGIIMAGPGSVPPMPPAGLKSPCGPGPTLKRRKMGNSVLW